MNPLSDRFMQIALVLLFSFSSAFAAGERADVAVTRYKATIQQTSEGKDLSGTYNSASVWVKKSGKWLEVLHTEVKAQ
jgi:hypothetical protein